jgi:hypothetical protein
MKVRLLALAFFAATILFSMVREWNAPVACARAILVPSSVARHMRVVSKHIPPSTRIR